MSRHIDADKLIADLEHDIAVDTDMILYPGTDNMKASLYQSDKDIKQNCIDMLSKAPTADVRENVRGKWIFHHNSADIFCSICDYEDEHHAPNELNFCPNCGADMRPRGIGKHADITIIDESVCADMRGDNHD